MAFSFSPTTREILEQVVREPRFREFTKIPLFAVMEIGLMLGAYLLFAISSFLYLNDRIALPLMLAFNGMAVYAAFTPLHDATHRTVSCNRRLNDLIGTISCGLLIPGITTRIYRYLHLEHHRYAGDATRDPDEAFVSAKTWRAPLVTAGLDVLWTIWYVERWRTRPVGERIEFVAALGVYVGIHVVMLSSTWWYEFLVIWMIPQRIGLFLVGWFFARIQHPENIQWEQAPFQTTVRIKTNRWGRYLLLGQAHHCLHHLAPSVPYYRYARAWRHGERLFETQNIPTRSLWAESNDIQLPTNFTTDRISVRVNSIEKVASDVLSFELLPLSNDSLPQFTAGAHIDVEMQDTLIRQYSLCNSSEETDRYVIAVRHDPDGRGGSTYLHTKVGVGTILKVSKPRNNFPLLENFDDYLLLAGGIGITPLLSMAYQLHRIGKPFQLHQRARSRQALPFGETLSELPFAERISLWLSDGVVDEHLDVDKVIGRYRSGRALYVCGPTGYMKSVIDAARDLGWPEDTIFSETFVPAQVKPQENSAFEVELARSGKTLHVGAGDALLDVLHNNGIPVMCSCTQGICGSCMTPVLSGVPDHRDAILTDEERQQNNQMTVCVSRARSEKLVLDI